MLRTPFLSASLRRFSTQSTTPLREYAPLLDSYLTYLETPTNPFTIPGHKQRANRLDAGLGKCVDVDVPLYGGLDEIKLIRKVLLRAEALAAKLWGGDWARYSTGGSTHGNLVVLEAIGQPGDKVVVNRTAHRSIYSGLAMAGLEPVWVMPIIDAASGVPLGVDPAVVSAKIKESGAKAVYVVEPGYMGSRSDVQSLAAAAHEHKVPLCVDQAWGAHHGFHPGLPPHALQDGADALVTSMHKAVPGYSGAAMIVTRNTYLDPARLDQAFEVQHTTSPAGAPLASCDGVRALLQLRGHELIGKLLPLVDGVRDALLKEFGPGIVLDPRQFKHGQLDRSKLIITTASLGADGVQVERDLLEHGIRVELADRDTLVPMITLVNNAADVEQLTKALLTSLKRRRGTPRVVKTALSWSITPTRAMSLRDAFFAKVEVVPAIKAIGRISADLIAPYPPGVPVVAPGERLTQEIVQGLQAVADSGVRVAYASDPSLKTFRVVR